MNTQKISNILWLLIQSAFMAVVVFLYKIDFYVFQTGFYSSLLSLLALSSVIITLVILVMSIVETRTLPNFNFVLQYLCIYMIVINVYSFMKIKQLDAFRMVNHHLFPINIENSSIDMYQNFGHMVYQWKDIKSPYFQKNYKEFVKHHLYYKQDDNLLRIAIDTDVNKYDTDQIKYTQALYAYVNAEDVKDYLYDHTEESAKVIAFFRIINPKVVNDVK